MKGFVMASLNKKRKRKSKKVKKIDVTMVYGCPEQEDFRFYRKCPIKTCQFWTSRTERRCMALDRRESSKGITDSELGFYKCPDLDSRQVFNERRKSLARVESIIILSEYIQYIIQEFEPKLISQELPQKVEELLNAYPLNVPELSVLPWMLPYLVDEECYQRFLNTEMKNRVDVINLNTLLDLTPRKFKIIHHEIILRLAQ
tara:strand:- start:1235 stop:1840 length:606 start_codon:yes stop_codon:yes gene_type:complete